MPFEASVVSLCATTCPCAKSNSENENGVVVDGYQKRKTKVLRKKFPHRLNTKQNNVKVRFFPILPDIGKSIPLFESSHNFSSCPSLKRSNKIKTNMKQWWNDGDRVKPRSTVREPSPSATVSTTDLTCTGPGMDLGLSAERQELNTKIILHCISYIHIQFLPQRGHSVLMLERVIGHSYVGK